MEASDRSGVLEPEEIKFIDLTVMESAPVGINEGTIFFIDDNAISRPVNYSITKLVNRQTWAVDAKDYSNTMNIIGQVMVDGVIQENPSALDGIRGASAQERRAGVQKLHLIRSLLARSDLYRGCTSRCS